MLKSNAIKLWDLSVYVAWGGGVRGVYKQEIKVLLSAFLRCTFC